VAPLLVVATAPLGRGAGDDHGLDAFLLQAGIEVGAYELVAAPAILDQEVARLRHDA
jgi:hypothetical protein